ncbi:MAG: hypothetical protein MK213_01185, partial [Planctomycetes bacterium]|nr:hypothetical protein [Planctomycetota bacterium]
MSMRLLALVFTTTFLVVSAPDAFAQKAKLGKVWHTDANHGYRFKYPDDWKDIPRDQPPVIAQIDGPSVSTKVDGNAAYQVPTQLKVFVFKQKAAVTREDEEGSGGLKDLVDSEAGGRQKIGEDSLEKVFGELLEFKEVETDEGKTKSKIAFERKVFEAGYNTGQVSFQMAFDTYTYHLDDFDIVLVYALPETILSKWGKVLLGTAKTFEEIERKRIAEVTDHTDYAQVLAAAKAEVETTAGWEVLEVPSKRYIVKTSSTDKKFLKDLLPRLEKSRDLFERDFPPSAPIEHISIVRVCKDYDEFTSYGQVPNGVVGFFSPSSTELVIVDLKSIDRNITWSTVTHEAFHQYCHFLFDESEAHRWFDEGHGDYYGFFEFKGKKAKAEYKRGGESRLAEIKPWIKSGNYTPISKLLKLNHPQWQAQY